MSPIDNACVTANGGDTFKYGGGAVGSGGTRQANLNSRWRDSGFGLGNIANSPRRSQPRPSHHNGGTRPGGEANLNSRWRGLGFGLGEDCNSPRRSKPGPSHHYGGPRPCGGVGGSDRRGGGFGGLVGVGEANLNSRWRALGSGLGNNVNSPRRSQQRPSHHNGGTRPGGVREANLNSRWRGLGSGLEDNFHPQTRPGGGVGRKVGGVGSKVGNSGKGARCAGSVVAPNKNKKSRKNGSPFFIRRKKKKKSTDKKNEEVPYKNTNKSQRLTSQQPINDESTRLSEPSNNSGTATQSSIGGYGEDPNNTIQAVKIM